MKLLTSILIFALSIVSFESIEAQTGTAGEIKYDTRDFTFTSLDDKGDFSGEILVTLKGVYNSEQKSFTLKKGDNDWVILSEPLSRKAFYIQLTVKLNEGQESTKYFSEANLNEVFSWMYDLRVGDKSPEIGRLEIGNLTSPVKPSYAGNTRERVEKLERSRNKLFVLTTSIETNKGNIIDRLKVLKQSIIDQAEDDKPYSKADTSILNEVMTKLAAGSYAEIPATLYRRYRLMSEQLRGEERESVDSAKNEIKSQQADYVKLKATAVQVQKQLDTIRSAIAALTPASTKDDALKSPQNELGARLKSFQVDSMTAHAALATAAQTMEMSQRRLETLLTRLASAHEKIVAGSDDDSLQFKSPEIKYLDEDYHAYHQSVNQLIALRKEFRADNLYEIAQVSIQFERGYIERIQVWVQNEQQGLDIYENLYAIGFSSVSNLKAFEATRLFIRKSPGVGFIDHIYLSDVLARYDNLVELYTRDYSPADSSINFFKPEYSPVVLRKERTVDLFESRIYTDLQGIQEDKPNGLVQIEASRKFNIRTYRNQLFQRADWGYLSYIRLSGGITKIENKAKYLPLRNVHTITNGVITSPSYVTNMDLRQYENAVLDLNVNAFVWDYPDGKMTAYVDAGLRYGHVRMIDTVYEVQGNLAVKTDRTLLPTAHTVTFAFPRINLEFFSERRVGFDLAYSYNYTMLFSNNDFKQVMSYAKSDPDRITTERLARFSHLFEVFLRAGVSKEGDGQVFFRTRFFWQRGDANTFFSQVQVGYSYNLFLRK